MTDTIDVDPDMRQMLDQLIIQYGADEGHIIRALLRERLERLKTLNKL